MNHAACPDCQVRFTPAQAAGMPSCPTCGGPLVVLSGPDLAVGLSLFEPDPSAAPLPEARTAALPIPGSLDGLRGPVDGLRF